MGREEWSPIKAWVRMFSQGVLRRTVCSWAIQAGSLLREAAVCPVAASEPLNCNLLVLQGHDQPPTRKNMGGDNWQQAGSCVEQSHLSLQRKITRYFRDELRLCGPTEPWLPPQIPQPSVTPGKGSARISPSSPHCQLISASGLRPAAGVGKKREASHSISKSPPVCLPVSW